MLKRANKIPKLAHRSGILRIIRLYVQVIAQVGFKTRFVPVPSELPKHPQKFRLSTVNLDFDCSAPL